MTDADRDLVREATQIARAEGQVSISMLQRRLHVGYTQAGFVVDELRRLGIVGPRNAGSNMHPLTQSRTDQVLQDAGWDPLFTREPRPDVDKTVDPTSLFPGDPHGE